MRATGSASDATKRREAFPIEIQRRRGRKKKKKKKLMKKKKRPARIRDGLSGGKRSATHIPMQIAMRKKKRKRKKEKDIKKKKKTSASTSGGWCGRQKMWATLQIEKRSKLCRLRRRRKRRS